jgi:3-dehydroquinate synthetase
LPTEIPSTVAIANLLQGMEVDKKAVGEKIKFVMCNGIGKTRFDWLTPAEIACGLGA